MIEIKHKETGKVLYIVEADTLQEANLQGVHMHGADLRDANLQSANLHAADLDEADIRGAHLYKADMSFASLLGASLNSADMSEANLQDANLAETDLYCADMSGADLSRANLRHAYMVSANLTDSHLVEADMSGGVFGLTYFTDTLTLHKAIGLEKGIHLSASRLDAATLRACVLHLPDTFLLGVGYKWHEIDTLRDLYRQGIQLYSCFLSYAGTDREFADRLRTDLLVNDVSCFDHRYDMRGGKFYEPQISQAIKIHDKMLLVCSRESVPNENVVKEVVEAMDREKESGQQKLFPLNLDGFILSDDALHLADEKMKAGQWARDWIRYLRQFHIPDFSGWKHHDTYQAEFQKLLRDLKNPVKRGESNPAVP